MSSTFMAHCNVCSKEISRCFIELVFTNLTEEELGISLGS